MIFSETKKLKMREKKTIDLTETTFIIPIKIEHPDRYRNAKISLEFLNYNFKTNVFIYEVADDRLTKLDFIGDLNNLNIDHQVHMSEGIFHRTKYLNIMLDNVKTKVVANYDVDVILESINYKECQNSILNGDAEVLYPYNYGESQFRVKEGFDYKGFWDSNLSTVFIRKSPDIDLYYSECGHCIFFNTDVYKKYGGENENFISYGPEDRERMERFKKLGSKVKWKPYDFVYHFEHYRGNDSEKTNPEYSGNVDLFNKLLNKTSPELAEYYRSQEYTKKYKTIGILN